MKLLLLYLWILIGVICIESDPTGYDVNFIQNFRREALDRHNKFRKGYDGSAPVIQNDMLCKSSQDRANQWSVSDGKPIADLPNMYPDYGENTYAINLKEGVEIYGSTPVDAWYDEIHDYDFTTGSNAPNTFSPIESFKLVVSKETTEMCISFAIGESKEKRNSDGLMYKKLYIVAHYNSEENAIGTLIKPQFQSEFFYKNSLNAPKAKHLTLPITDDVEEKVLNVPEMPSIIVIEPNVIQVDDDKIEENELVKLAISGKKPIQKHIFFRGHNCGKFPVEHNISTPVEWIEKAIVKVNRYRLTHGVPEVIHSELLDEIAQNIANTFVIMDFTTLPKSNMSGCGETIFTKVGERLEAFEPIDEWYKQVENYDFKHSRAELDDKSVDSFAQLVWKNTKEIGIAFSQKNGKFIVVAIYAPAGNQPDKFKANVYSRGSMLYISILAFGVLLFQIGFNLVCSGH